MKIRNDTGLAGETTSVLFRCRFCDSPMRVSAQSYKENPFCAGCYHERAMLVSAGRPPVRWRLEGEYMVAVPEDET